MPAGIDAWALSTCLLHRDLSSTPSPCLPPQTHANTATRFNELFDFPKEIQELLEENFKDGCEGLTVKMLEGGLSHYEPSRRTVNWLKVRPTTPFVHLCANSPQPGTRRARALTA